LLWSRAGTPTRAGAWVQRGVRATIDGRPHVASRLLEGLTCNAVALSLGARYPRVHHGCLVCRLALSCTTALCARPASSSTARRGVPQPPNRQVAQGGRDHGGCRRHHGHHWDFGQHRAALRRFSVGGEGGGRLAVRTGSRRANQLPAACSAPAGSGNLTCACIKLNRFLCHASRPWEYIFTPRFRLENLRNLMLFSIEFLFARLVFPTTCQISCNTVVFATRI